MSLFLPMALEGRPTKQQLETRVRRLVRLLLWKEAAA